MNTDIPQTGFYISKNNNQNLSEINHKLELKGAKTIIFTDDNVILASWKQFDDQGMWSDGKNAIAYDMDLTNLDTLCQSEGLQSSGAMDKGRFLWQLYRKYGINFVDRLRGTFAFGLWDGMNKDLYVVTDPYGIKPVVYSNQDDNFSAATRINHLLFAQTFSKSINNDAIFHYLFFQAICSPLTIYREIVKLEPGKGLHHKKNKLTRLTHYDIAYQPDRSLTEKDWVSKIRNHVKNAVDVFVPLSSYEKTGCFLSGGTDSSSIAGFYTQLAGKPARTFSIGFDDPRYNELDYARIACKRFKTDYHEYYVTPQDVTSLIERLPGIYDEPFGNASVIPAFYCAHHAAGKGIEVMLGGDGGDEIFGGNERYVTNLVFQRYLNLPGIIRTKMVEPMLSIMPDKGIFYKAKRYVRRANISNPERFYSYNLLAEVTPGTIFRQDFIDGVNFNSFINIAKKHYQNAAPADDTDRLLYLDMKFTITDNDIRKVTQMVEAAGLRVRYPLLDRDLVDFTCTIPPELKVKWGKGRYIFKQAMKGFLPDEIINKSKHGMGLPVTPWFKNDKKMHELLYDTLFTGKPEISNYIKPDFIHLMKDEFEKDETTYYGDNLWVYLILELWLKQK
ncbi:MAG: hypothetical protein GXP56_01005 [Deltaproteobacteria bacterium]|nr:hypothetical protein [Deltaproteobacteria bacterium]